MADQIVSTFTTVTTANGSDYLPILVQSSPGSYVNRKIAVSDFSNGTGITINPTDTYMPVRVNGSEFEDSPWYVPFPDTLYADGSGGFVRHNLATGYSFFYHTSSTSLKTIGPNYISLQVPSLNESYSLAASIATINTTGAVLGLQQFSPALVVQGGGFSTYYGPSQYVAFGAVSAPEAGSPDAGGQFQIVSSINNSASQLEFAVARNSGYSGLGTKALFDDGTYYTVSSGSSSGSVTINPTDKFIPDRANGSTFEDSPIKVLSATAMEVSGSYHGATLPFTFKNLDATPSTGQSVAIPFYLATDISEEIESFRIEVGREFPWPNQASAIAQVDFQTAYNGGLYDQFKLNASGIADFRAPYAITGFDPVTNVLGVSVSATALAVNGTQISSPAFIMRGDGWNVSLGASRAVYTGFYVEPYQTGAAPGGYVKLHAYTQGGVDQTIFSVDTDSGYTGSGTNFLGDDGKYHLINGSLVNPTDQYVPYRYNGTFNDSALKMLPDYGVNVMGFDQPNGLGSFMIVNPQSEFVFIQGSTGNGDWNTIGKGLYYATAYNVNNPLKHLPYPQGVLLSGEASGTTTSNTPGVLFVGRGYSGVVGYPDTVYIGVYGEIFDAQPGVNQPTGRLTFKSFIGTNAINGMMEIDLIGNGTFSGNVSVRAVPYIWPAANAVGALTNDGNGILSWAGSGGGGSTSFANPTGVIGLTAVNGVSTAAIRSDASQALDQGINPQWTGSHSFRGGAAFGPSASLVSLVVSSQAFPYLPVCNGNMVAVPVAIDGTSKYPVVYDFNTDNIQTYNYVSGIWRAHREFTPHTTTDTGSAFMDLAYGGAYGSISQNTSFSTLNRRQGRKYFFKLTSIGGPFTLTFPAWNWVTPALTSIPANTTLLIKLSAFGANDTDITAESVSVAGSAGSTTFADPTGVTGLSAVNGTSSSAMRSDAAPALDQGISPTWTGSHTYARGVFVGTNAEAFWLQPVTSEVYVAYSDVSVGDPNARDAYMIVDQNGAGTDYGEILDYTDVSRSSRLLNTTVGSRDFYWRFDTGIDDGDGFATAVVGIGTDGIVTRFDPAFASGVGPAYLFDTATPVNFSDRIASFAHLGNEKLSLDLTGYGTFATGVCAGTSREVQITSDNGGRVHIGKRKDVFSNMDIGIFHVANEGETRKAWINIGQANAWPNYTAAGEWWANTGTVDCVMDLSWLDGAGVSRDHVWVTSNDDTFFSYEMKRNGTVVMSLQPCIADTANFVAYTLDTFNTLDAAGAKIASFRNKTVEKASIGYDGAGTFASNVFASNTVFGVGTLPVASAVSGTLYFDFAGSAYQQTTASGTFMLSAKNYRPGIAIVAQVISDGTARAITYDNTFAWFGTQIPSTVATTGKQILVTLTSTSNAASGIIAASTPQI